MAVPAYTTDLATITLSEATTGFAEPTSSTAGGVASQESDYFIQGSFCISKTFNATGIGGLAYTGSSVTIPTDGAVYTWIYFAAPNAVSSKATGGMQILAGSSGANYKRFYVAGNDTYTYGGWVNFPVNPSSTASATVGTPSGTWTTFGYAVNAANAIAKGNPFGIDAIRYGRGTLQVTAGEVGNYATFLGASTENDLSSNRWGILSLVDAVYKFQGHLLLGTAGTAVNFVDSNDAMFIQNTEFVTSAFNLIEIRNASSSVSWTGITISSLSTVSRGNFLVTDNATVSLDGCTFNDMGTFALLSNTTVVDTTWRRCQTITHGGSSISQSSIIASPSTTALTTSNPDSISDCEFVSSGTGHAITLTATGTYTLDNLIFTGYGSDGTTNAAIYNNSGGAVTLNVSGGSTPTVRNGTGASTTVVASANVTFTGLIADSEVRAYLGTNPATSTAIAGTESSGTSYTFSQSVAGQQGYVHIIHVNYQPIYLPITFSSQDVEIPIQQVVDRQYSRGSVFIPS